MTRITFFILLMMAAASLMAQEKTPVQTVKPDSTKTINKGYRSIVTEKTISKKGLFTIHQTGDNYFFEIPDSLLGRELLLTTWLVKVPGGSPKFGGEIMNTKTIVFDKYRDNKIGLSVVTTISQSDTANVISKAVKNSNLNSVSFVYDIKARGAEGRSSVIDVSDLLQKENSLTILSAEVKSKMGLAAMAPDRSYVKSVASYPINMEIKMLRTYTASPAPQKTFAWSARSRAA